MSKATIDAAEEAPPTSPGNATGKADQPRRPKKPLPSPFIIVGLVTVVAITVWAARQIDFTLMPLITDLTRGSEIIAGYFNPSWEFIWRESVRSAWLETFAMAIIASLIGNAVGLVLSMLASKVTAPNLAVYQIFKAILSVVRSLPDIAYGLLFVAAVGTGALGGIAALIMFNIGVTAKLTSETIDAVDMGPVEAADASGANLAQRARWAVLPQIMPNYLSYCFYVFELNIRASVVLGIVGGGGIGVVISTQLARGIPGAPNLGAIIIALFVLVFILDIVSRRLRTALT